jgi:hypothetical protein
MKWGGVMNFIKKRALEQKKTIRDNRNNLFIIHYSCEAFIDNEQRITPRISAICVRKFSEGITQSFSIHLEAEIKGLDKNNIEEQYNELEKSMLTNFYEFLKLHKNAYFIHWNMRDVNYGFQAIEQRYSMLGGRPTAIEENKRIDLAQLLSNMYGPNYIEHPRMEKLIDHNSITKQDFLSGKKEAEEFNNKNYLSLHKSTLRKVDAIGEILKLFLINKLKTRTNRFQQFIENIYEHALFRFISMLCVFFTFTAVIYKIIVFLCGH